MAQFTIPGRLKRGRNRRGYALLIFLFAITIMSFGLIVAVPVWETQVQREREEELIFRGKQYVEGVRLYQLKNPGGFPKTLDEMVEKKCLRRLFRDPMTKEGAWNVILQQEGFGGLTPAGMGPGGGVMGRGGPSRQPGGAGPGGGIPGGGIPSGGGTAKVMVAPVTALSSIQNARIIGVVSSSTKKSIRIYNDQESYDKWLFFFGQDPKTMPEIVYYGRSEKGS